MPCIHHRKCGFWVLRCFWFALTVVLDSWVKLSNREFGLLQGENGEGGPYDGVAVYWVTTGFSYRALRALSLFEW